MQKAGRLAERLLVALVVWAAANAVGAEPNAEELAVHCRTALAGLLQSPTGDLQAELSALQSLATLQPSQITAEGPILVWPCLPKRKLMPEEECRVWDGQETILRTLLAHTPRSGSDRPPLTDAEAERIVRACKLGFLIQPPLREIPAEEIRQAILRYVQRAAEQGEGDPELAGLLRAISLDPQKLSVNGLCVTWSVAPAPDLVATAEELQERLIQRSGNLRRRSPQLQASVSALQRATRQFVSDVESREPALRRAVVAALSQVPSAETGIPLVSEDAASALVVDLSPETWDLEVHAETAMAAAPMMLEKLRATTSKGSAQRTLAKLSRLAWAPEPSEPQPLLVVGADQGMGGLEKEPPQLVVDTGGFAGGNVTALAFSPDGQFLAAAGDVVRIWNLADGSLHSTLRGQRKLSGVGSCTDLAFSPDGRRLYVAAAGFGASVRVYDMADLSEPVKVVGSHEGHVDRLAVSPDGRWLLTVGVDSELHVCDVSTDRMVARVKLPEMVDHLSFPAGQSWALLIDVKGRHALLDVSPREDGSGGTAVRLAPPPDESALLERLSAWLSGAPQWAPGGGPHGFALAADLAHGRIAAGGLDRSTGTARYWSAVWLGNSVQPDQIHKHSYFVTACALSADGQWVASADAMGEIHVWNAATGALRYQLGAKNAAVYAVSFDPAGTRIFLGRTPLKPGTGWNYNHYGLLTHQFDRQYRTLSPIEPREPSPPRLEHAGRTLSISRDRNGVATLSIARGAQGESQLPFGGSSRQLPLAFTFLTGEAIGQPGAVAVAGESGGVTLYEPSQFRSRQALIGHSDRVWCLAQSADGRLLASGSGDGTVRFWKLAPPRPWGNLAAYADDDDRLFHVVPGTPTEAAGIRAGDRIQTIEYRSPSELLEELLRTGKWPFRPAEKVEVVLQRGENVYTEQVALSDMGDIAEPLLSLYVTPDGSDWVAWTPEGYYDASLNGDRYIGWHVNRGEGRSADFYRAEQFRNQFYRPDVIARLWEQADLAEALRLADMDRSRPTTDLDVRRDAEGLKPPRVRILEPSSALRTGQRSITLKADVASTSQLPLRDAHLIVNGKAGLVKDVVLESAGGPSVERVDPRHWIVRQDVELTPGRNELAVIASTEVAASTPVSVRVTYRPDAAPGVAPRLFVVAIGIAEYANPQFRLQYADADARDFAAAWESQKNGLYSDVQSRVLLNAEATKPAVLDAMQWLIDSVGVGDVAILFLSGHGVCDESQNYYLATHEIDPDRLRATALSWRDVLGTVYDLRYRRLLMFVDTCHGGGAAGVTAVQMDPFRELPKDDVGAVLYASCAPQAVSLEHPDWKHGAFTKAFLETLSSRDSDLSRPADGSLSLLDLAKNLEDRVKALTKGQQVPVFGIPTTLTSFDIYRLP